MTTPAEMMSIRWATGLFLKLRGSASGLAAGASASGSSAATSFESSPSPTIDTKPPRGIMASL